MNRQNRFDTRGFVALIIALCGLGLPITGVANHLHGFNPLSVARHAWMSAHNCLGLLFILFAIWHLVLNRRALWKYFRGAATRAPALTREAIWAFVIIASVLILFTGHAFHAGG